MSKKHIYRSQKVNAVDWKRLGGPVAVVMEPSGTYGDSLRHLCRQAGFSVFQASP